MYTCTNANTVARDDDFVSPPLVVRVQPPPQVQTRGNGVSMNTRATAIKLVVPMKKFNKCQKRAAGNRVVLNIREEDVQAMLGLPRGEVVITKRAKDDVSDLLKEWWGKFVRDSHDITLGMIGRKFGDHLQGDIWFKRHFAILVVSTLCTTMGNGYAYQLIFNHFEDVEKIKDLNWCRFLLECLVDIHGKWIHKQNQPFTGLLLFLTVDSFYEVCAT
nr:uncharacterized protein LOC109189836 [Ipomoea trifida]